MKDLRTKTEFKRACFEFLSKYAECILLPLAMAYMLCIYAPMEMYINNAADLWFSEKHIVKYMATLFLSMWILLSVILIAAKRFTRTAYLVLLCIVLILLAAFFIQGNLLVNGLPILDGEEIDWEGNINERVRSVGAVVCPLGVCFLMIKNMGKKKFVNICKYIGGGLTVFFLITLAGAYLAANASHRFDGSNAMIGTSKNKFAMSSEQNCVVLILDTIDGRVFKNVLESNDEYKELFEGFTFYNDVLATHSDTARAVPLMATGIPTIPNQTLFEFDGNDYYTNAFEKSEFLKSLRRDGYSVGLYLFPQIKLNKDRLQGVFDNYESVSAEKMKVSDFPTGLKLVAKLAGIKYAPWQLKHLFYDLQEFSNKAAVETENGDNPWTTYMMDQFYNSIVNEDRFSLSAQKVFKLIYLFGAHRPLVLNERVEPAENVSYEESIRMCITVCKAYFDRLKELGIYDKTAVAIVGDHGRGDDFEVDGEAVIDNGSNRRHTIFMAKGMREKGEIKYSDIPLATYDFPEGFAALSRGARGDELFQIPETKGRERWLYFYFGRYVTSGAPDDLASIRRADKETQDRLTALGIPIF